MRAVLLAAPLAFAMPALAQDDATILLNAAKSGDGKAQYQLAEAYLLGVLGLKEDDMQAALWAQKSADQGNGDAEALLAGFYLEGIGVPKDQDKAAAMADLAMAQKNGRAFYIGARIARARTTAPDHDQRANSLLRVGASLGNRPSMMSLGEVFTNGTGVKPDFLQAYVWYGVAALAFGPRHIPQQLDGAFQAVTAKLTPDQAKSAQELVVQCARSGLKDCGQPDLPGDSK
jgi:TPR repeat protein